MNSWHLSLTILAVCTVSPLAAAQNIEMKAEADIVSPDGKVNGTVKFVQQPGSNKVKYNIEMYGLSQGIYSLFVYEKADTGNDCRNLVSLIIPTNATAAIERVGFIFGFRYYLHESPLSEEGTDDRISLTGEHNIIGRGVGVIQQFTFACGVIYTTNDTVTNAINTTSTPSTTSTTSTRRTISTTSAPSTTSTTSTRRTTSRLCTTRTTVSLYRKIQPVYAHCYTPEAQIICPPYYLHRQQQYPHPRAHPCPQADPNYSVMTNEIQGVHVLVC